MKSHNCLHNICRDVISKRRQLSIVSVKNIVAITPLIYPPRIVKQALDLHHRVMLANTGIESARGDIRKFNVN